MICIYKYNLHNQLNGYTKQINKYEKQTTNKINLRHGLCQMPHHPGVSEIYQERDNLQHLKLKKFPLIMLEQYQCTTNSLQHSTEVTGATTAQTTNML